MDELNKQNNNPGVPPAGGFIGTGEGEAPLATPAQMPDLMRTAASDMKTFQETGGQNVKPYIPETVSPASFSPQNNQETEKSAAAPKAPGQDFQPAAATPVSEKKAVPAKNHKKGFVGGLVAFGVVIVLAAVGYFFIYPMLNSQSEAELPAIIPETPATENLEVIPPTEQTEAPIVPIVPAATTTEPTAEEETPGQTMETHVSLLTDTDSAQEVILPTVSADGIKNSITDTTSETAAIKEIQLKKETGEPASFSEVMASFLPTVFTEETAAQFESYQYSVLAFTNSQGTWLGYVGQAKTGTDLPALKNKVNLIEAANLTSAFLGTAGEQVGEWKSGANNRYLAFSQKNNALNYGWLGSKLLITTSYPAWQAISAKIQ